MSAIGLPHRPNPPTASDAPSGTSATAAAADATTLSSPVPRGDAIVGLMP